MPWCIWKWKYITFMLRYLTHSGSRGDATDVSISVRFPIPWGRGRKPNIVCAHPHTGTKPHRNHTYVKWVFELFYVLSTFVITACENIMLSSSYRHRFLLLSSGWWRLSSRTRRSSLYLTCTCVPERTVISLAQDQSPSQENYWANMQTLYINFVFVKYEIVLLY